MRFCERRWHGRQSRFRPGTLRKTHGFPAVFALPFAEQFDSRDGEETPFETGGGGVGPPNAVLLKPPAAPAAAKEEPFQRVRRFQRAAAARANVIPSQPVGSGTGEMLPVADGVAGK